jgi:hypothetical protein
MVEPVAAPDDVRSVLRRDCTIAKMFVSYAWKCTGDGARAVDAAQEAIARVIEGKRWYARKSDKKELFGHLADVVDTVVANEKRRAYRRREVAPNPERDEKKRDSDANIEVRAARAEDDDRRQRLADRVMARVEKDAIIPGMLVLEQEGIGGAAEQAERLGCTHKEIYRARERLAHHRDVVLAEARKNGELP